MHIYASTYSLKTVFRHSLNRVLNLSQNDGFNYESRNTDCIDNVQLRYFFKLFTKITRNEIISTKFQAHLVYHAICFHFL